jgi:hypothetical protein
MDQSPLLSRGTPTDFAAFRDRIVCPHPQFAAARAQFVRATRPAVPLHAHRQPAGRGRPLKRLVTVLPALFAVMITVSHFTPASTAAPAQAPVTPVNYPWMATRADKLPITWPCGPIHYRVALDGAPAGAAQLVTEALDRISAVSGYQFQNDPPIDHMAGQDLNYAGIDIAWARRQDVLGADDRNAIGSGGPAHQPGGAHYTHGVVQLRRDWPGNMRADFHAKDAGPVLLHELGHALGLAHTKDPRAIMYPTDLGVTDWSPPEWAALQYLHQLCG